MVAANGQLWVLVTLIDLLPASIVMRSSQMPVTIETLQRQMEDAAAVLDFEEARRCLDQINSMRSGATAVEVEEADFAGLKRQKLGEMGLGTSQQRVTPRMGWHAPPEPELVTADRSKRGGCRS